MYRLPDDPSAVLRAADDPVLVLWHAQSLLREFRGDGHIAALVTEGISGIEALVLHGGTGEVPRRTLQSTRGWTDDEWNAAALGLRSRGWLEEDGSLTDAGRAHRQGVEDRTDALARPAYEALGEDGCARLRTLVRPFAKAVVESTAFGFTNPILADPEGHIIAGHGRFKPPGRSGSVRSRRSPCPDFRRSKSGRSESPTTKSRSMPAGT